MMQNITRKFRQQVYNILSLNSGGIYASSIILRQLKELINKMASEHQLSLKILNGLTVGDKLYFVRQEIMLKMLRNIN